MAATFTPSAPLLAEVIKAKAADEYWIRTYLLEGVKPKIEKLVRRAEKLGASAIAFTVTSDKAVEVRYHTDWTGKRHAYEVEYTKVVVRGEAPKMNGWRLVGRLLHESQTGVEGGVNIINAVPGETMPEVYRTSGCQCQHCGRNWLVRKDTYVVAHDSGEYRQVGSNCLADFLGHNDPKLIAELASLYTDGVAGVFGGEDDDLRDDEPHGLFVRGASCLRLESLLQYVQAFSRVVGWTTSSQAYASGGEKHASAPIVASLMLTPFGRMSEDMKKLARQISEATTPEREAQDEAYALAAIEWAKGIEAGTDFEHNIKAIAASGLASERTLGMACAIIGAYTRHIERENRDKARRETAKADGVADAYFGEEGQRYEVRVNVLSVRAFEGRYGANQIHTLRDEQGHEFIWWASSMDKLPVGQWLTVKLTVKKHSEYKGVKQTTVTRVAEVKPKAPKARKSRKAEQQAPEAQQAPQTAPEAQQQAPKARPAEADMF